MRDPKPVTTEDPTVPFDARRNLREKITITWKTVGDIQAVCKREFARFGARLTHEVDACAIWAGERCTIYTRHRPPLHDVGHEVRHCYQEHWH
ncbi:MAG: hypothetical protein RIS35_1010 [Pseudomonadota bacterium]|jgi:hypothetical protein